MKIQSVKRLRVNKLRSGRVWCWEKVRGQAVEPEVLDSEKAQAAAEKSVMDESNAVVLTGPERVLADGCGEVRADEGVGDAGVEVPTEDGAVTEVSSEEKPVAEDASSGGRGEESAVQLSCEEKAAEDEEKCDLDDIVEEKPNPNERCEEAGGLDSFCEGSLAVENSVCDGGERSSLGLAGVERRVRVRGEEDMPENPEVSSRLTNLSLRHDSSRPEWYNFEPLALRGRTRQCRRMYWQIVGEHTFGHKRMMALVAESGMGKTSFIAELHSMLEHAPQNVLTLAPNSSAQCPYYAIKNILEQRFYISGDAPYDCIRRFVTGAVSAIVSAEKSAEVIDGILAFWRPDKSFSKGNELPGVRGQLKLHAGNLEPIKAFVSKEGKKGCGEESECADGVKVLSVPQILELNAGSEASEVEEDESSEEKTFVLPGHGVVEKTEEVLDAKAREARGRELLLQISEPIRELFRADLEHNALVIVLDDVENFDTESLELLSELYQEIPDESRLTVVVTTRSRQQIPGSLHACSMDFEELSALSDADLSLLTHHLIKKLSEKREKQIVPREICNLIAQRSFGSPRRAIELTVRHFNPESMIHWNEAIEQLRHESIPHALALKLVHRFRDCPELEKTILQLSSLLNAPFTVSTIECILSMWPEYKAPEGFSCSEVLRELRERAFLERAEGAFGMHTPAYVFKHECERKMISGTVGEAMRQHVYCSAAQWYSLNNASGMYDEVIGDLWRSVQYMHEACRFYERAAYGALNKSHLGSALALFRKLLKSLPDASVSARIHFSLDGAVASFRRGLVDEAFRLCRSACRAALKISAYNQASRACIQMAEMLIEMGSIRHVKRYLSRAHTYLNRESCGQTTVRLYLAHARSCLFESRYRESAGWILRARECAKNEELSVRERLILDWTEAETEAGGGDPVKATAILQEVIRASEHIEDAWMRARAYQSLGSIYFRLDNISSALEAWNLSLGLVQEMNDVSMHSHLLADISDAALVLEARRTARAATEECLGMAQQMHQKPLIARCLSNTSRLQYANGQTDRAMRTVRKAHRIASGLHNVHLLIRTLLLYVQLHARQNTEAALENQKINSCYRQILKICERRGMHLERGRMLRMYADYLRDSQQPKEALSAYRESLEIYQRFGLERSEARIKESISRLLRASEG